MSRPPWVLKDLCSLLGFDEETVKEALLPDLEGYKNEVKLRSHLQDFLGSTPEAKNFARRYLALRFPNIASSSLSTATPPPNSGPTKLKPKVSKSNLGTPAKPPPRGPSPNIPDVLDAAFGPGGKVYQKNREADDTATWGRSNSPGSGSHTPNTASGPSLRQPMPLRAGGAVTMQVQEPRGRSRIDQGGFGSVGEGRKGKDKEEIWDVPKSREVKRLEEIVADLRELQQGDGKVRAEEKVVPDCFCQARVHPLSAYIPHCSHCGLIICILHPPHHPCPSCHHPLLSPAQVARLLLRIQSENDSQLAFEQAERDEAERDRLARLAAESGGGAFPTLGGGRSQSSQAQERGRKVLTLGKGGKGKATLTTTFTRPSSTSSPAGPGTPPPTDVISRPRSPPLDAVRIEKELNKALSWRVAEDRPWGDMKADKKGEVWKYVEVIVPESIMEDAEGRRKAARKKKAGKGVGMDGKAVPGAAVA